MYVCMYVYVQYINISLLLLFYNLYIEPQCNSHNNHEHSIITYT